MNEDFKLVENKRKTRNKRKPKNSGENDDVDDLCRRIEEIKERLKHYDDAKYWDYFCFEFRKFVSIYFGVESMDPETVRDELSINLVCFGLGSPDENLNSRYQLGFLLLIVDFLKDLFKSESILNSIELFDPIFTDVDKKLLSVKYKFKICESNTRCMHRVNEALEKRSLTIFYMPHCGKSLYNNLLYSNWSIKCLSSLVILGNDFETIDQLTLDEKMLKHYTYIKDTLKLMKKRRLDSAECSLTNAFQDLCIQYFTVEDLKSKLNSPSLINQLTETDQQTQASPIIEVDDNEII